MLPYQSIEAVESVDTPLSPEMANALDNWYKLYTNRAPWLGDSVKSLNLPAFISSELARQILLELKWNITGKNGDTNKRAEYLKAEFEKMLPALRHKLEQGCAAGGMTIKPYTKDGHLFFDFTMDWSLYPVAFDDDGNMSDVIFRDMIIEGKTIYNRLERHTVLNDDSVRITQRAFKSTVKDSIGVPIPLTDVPQWADLAPDAIVKNTGGQMFGWFKVAAANNIDPDSPMGASCFAKAKDTIEQADRQYSRLLWEFEGSELAIDVDPTALRPRKTEGGAWKMPELNQRLFRAVDIEQRDHDLYNVYSPAIRDANLINGLNQLYMRIEDQCGLARGTIADPNTEARTATELTIVRQRSYATVADNQAALERCLRDVIRVMDLYASMYGLAPAGEYDVSFTWDDSIITDTEQELNDRLALLNVGMMGKAEFRMWYFGETRDQAEKALAAIVREKVDEQSASMSAILPQVPSTNTVGDPPPVLDD